MVARNRTVPWKSNWFQYIMWLYHWVLLSANCVSQSFPEPKRTESTMSLTNHKTKFSPNYAVGWVERKGSEYGLAAGVAYREFIFLASGSSTCAAAVDSKCKVCKWVENCSTFEGHSGVPPKRHPGRVPHRCRKCFHTRKGIVSIVRIQEGLWSKKNCQQLGFMWTLEWFIWWNTSLSVLKCLVFLGIFDMILFIIP